MAPDPRAHVKRDRLKPAALDVLEDIGLPSKGEKRLFDFNLQERYYEDILRRTLAISGLKNNDDALLGALQALQITDTHSSLHHGVNQTRSRMEDEALAGIMHSQGQGQVKDMSVVIMAMRKLREAFIATERVDDVARKAYLFIVRASIIIGHVESYFPALLYFLRRFQTHTTSPNRDSGQMYEYYVIDLICRRRDFHSALQLISCNSLWNSNAAPLLQSLIHDDWIRFKQVQDSMDPYQQLLAKPAWDHLRSHAAICLGKAYLSLDKSYFTQALQNTWEEFQQRQQTSWSLEGNEVIIKRIKRR